jgi:hypothetical protein
MWKIATYEVSKCLNLGQLMSFYFLIELILIVVYHGLKTFIDCLAWGLHKG